MDDTAMRNRVKAAKKIAIKHLLTAVLAAMLAALFLLFAAVQWYPPLQQNGFVPAADEAFLQGRYAAGEALPVEVNTAPAEELCVLPGIGETRAQAIVEYRQKHGPFKNLEDLLAVHGLGPKTVQGLENLVCF